jgi:hypothetical protein
VIRFEVGGKKRARAPKIRLRLAKLGYRLVLDRDVISAINIRLSFSPMGDPLNR